MATITTRPARKSDAAEIALLVNVVTDGGMAHFWSGRETARGPNGFIEAGRCELLGDDAHFGWRPVTIAEVDGEVVGMMLGYRKPDAFEPVPPSVTGFLRPIEELEAEAHGMWYLKMLGVHEQWRGKGVGSALLAVADGKVPETGAHGLALSVDDHNSGARRLYERHGFVQRQSRPKIAVSGDGPGDGDHLLMVKN